MSNFKTNYNKFMCDYDDWLNTVSKILKTNFDFKIQNLVLFSRELLDIKYNIHGKFEEFCSNVESSKSSKLLETCFCCNEKMDKLEFVYCGYLNNDKKCKDILVNYTYNFIIDNDRNAIPLLIVFGNEIVNDAVRCLDFDNIDQKILNYIINLEVIFGSNSSLNFYNKKHLLNKNDMVNDAIYDFIINFIYWFITEKNAESIDIEEYYLIPVLKKLKNNKNLCYNSIVTLSQMYKNCVAKSTVHKYIGEIISDFFISKIRKLLDNENFVVKNLSFLDDQLEHKNFMHDLEFVERCLKLRYGETPYDSSIIYCIKNIKNIQIVEYKIEDDKKENILNMFCKGIYMYVGVGLVCKLWNLYC